MQKKVSVLTYYLIFFLLNTAMSGARITPHKRVLLDGTFDVPHYGHMGAMNRAKQAAAEFFHTSLDEIDLVVAVTDMSNKEFKRYKREPIYKVEEKLKQIEGFNVVHEVVRIPTTYVNEQFMIQHQIDLVVAGDDYSTEPKKSQFYGDPVRLGKFVNFPRTPGISTTDIIARAVFHSLDRIKEDLKCRLNTPEEKETDPQDFQIVEAFEGLLNRYLKRPTP